MAKMIVVIGPDAEQNRQFAEQMKHQNAYELGSQQRGNEAQAQPDVERLPSPVLSRDFELEQERQAQQPPQQTQDVSGAQRPADVDLIPAGQPAPGTDLEPREPDVKYVHTTPIEDGNGGGGGTTNALPGAAGEPAKGPVPQVQVDEETKEVPEWKPPEHEFGHNATDDPRQMLLTEVNKDMAEYKSAFEYVKERYAEAQQNKPDVVPTPDAPPSGDPPSPGSGQLPPGRVEVTQEEKPGGASQQREDVIDAEFREAGPERVTAVQVEREVPGRELPGPAPEPSTAATPERILPAPEQEAPRAGAVETARQEIAADKTVVVTATEYNADVQRLMEEARAQGHRVQVAVIGEQQGGQVTVQQGHLDAVPELSKNSSYVSVYAPNEAGKYELQATNYSDQPKVTPNVAPEVGNQLAKGVEAKGLHENVTVQQVEGFKASHPAVTRMEAQPNRGMSYE